MTAASARAAVRVAQRDRDRVPRGDGNTASLTNTTAAKNHLT